MKKYNLTLTEAYNPDIERTLLETGVKIKLHDEFLNDFLIVETDDANVFGKLNFIRQVEPTGIGKLLVLPKRHKKTILDVIPTPEVSAEDLRVEGLYGLGQKIAVLDSGHDVSWCGDVDKEANFTQSTTTFDTIGHGSIVISLIKRYSRGAQVYSVKVCESMDYLDEEAVHRGLIWVMNESDAKIINMSFGFERNCSGICNLSRRINKMAEMGYIFIAAAGNDSSQTVTCPGCTDKSITVGALDISDNRVANFSSAGHVNSNKPDLVTSGQGIYKVEGVPEPYWGTSFAAPIVTGVIGAIIPVIENKNQHKIKQYLIESSQMLLDEPVKKQGSGKLNLPTLLEVVKNDNKVDSTFE